MKFSFFQVYPLPEDVNDMLNRSMAVATGEDNTLTNLLATGDQQATISAMFSFVSVLNVPPTLVVVYYGIFYQHMLH